ncbi:MAG: zf-HC2 domain-containing protein [Edaphobacter sp.]
MAEVNSNSVRLVDGHIPESWIFRTVDKEIAADDCEVVEEHLRSCVACRSVADRYKETLDQLSEYKRVIVDPDFALSPSHQLVFEDKLDRLAGVLKRPGRFRLPNAADLWRSLRDALAPQARILACAALAIIVAFFVIFRSNVPTVSAKESLIRSVGFEQNSLQGISDPIVVQKIRINAGSHQSERTLYRDPQHNRQVHEIDDSNNQDERFVDSMVQRASLNADELLLPGLFLDMSSRNKASTISMRQNGADAVVAIHLPGNDIVDAELTLRDGDFHTIGALLHLRDQSTIQITELSYHVVGLRTLRAGLFDFPTQERSSELALSSPLKPIADPVSEEIAALSILHKIHAELGGEISVDDSNPKVVKIEGVVDDAARKQEIESALRDLSLVQPYVVTLAEKRKSLRAHVYENRGAVSATSAKPLLDKQLEERFPSLEERQEYVRGVLSYAQSASSYAWVLDELSRRFTSARYSTLHSKTRRELNHLLADEAKSLSEDIAGLERQIDTILGPRTSMSAPNSVEQHEGVRREENLANWQDQVHVIHSDLDKMNDDLNALIVGAGRHNDSSDQLRSETYQLLSSLTTDIQKFQGRLEKL